MAGGPTLVVDADSHVMEPARLWQDYIDPPFRDRALRVVENGGVEQLVIDRDQMVLPGALAGLGGSHIERSRLFLDPSLRYADGCPPASFEPAARAALLDEWGIDAGVLFPTLGILWVTEQSDLASAHCRAYNRWLAEFAAAIPGRVVPVAHLNLLDPDEAARELDWCLDHGFRAVFLPPEPVGGRRPGDPAFDPIWRRCAAAGVPVCLHVVVRFGGATVSPLAGWYEPGAGVMLFSFTLGAPYQIISALTTMVCDGVFDRIPDLRVLCVEAGCGWAGYLMDRLDEKFEHFSWMVPLQRKPSEYLRENVWYVAEPDERGIASQLDLVGRDRILWGSDFPHIDSTTDAAERVRASLAGLDPADRDAVLGGNAARLFGLGGIARPGNAP